MEVVVLGPDALVSELFLGAAGHQVSLHRVRELHHFSQFPTANAYVDLEFDMSEERIKVLRQLTSLVVVHSVLYPLSQVGASFVRINGWPTFLKASTIEASCLDENIKAEAETIFQQLGKRLEWVPDEPGFITPRVISMIINEAYFALSEGVSTKDEINTAMKLGTAYPYGPFEWGQLIGLQQIAALLQALSKEASRYTPCPWLLREANETGLG